MEEKVPDVLYHYCSVDTFVNIIQRKTLRLSEMTKSNDSMECYWLTGVVLPRILKKRYQELIEDNHLESGSDTIARSVETYCDDAMSILENSYKDDRKLTKSNMILASCYSENSDILSQWRGYANDGYGLSVGFDSQLFTDFASKDIMSPLGFRKVIYKTDDQDSLIRQEANYYIEAIRSNRIENLTAALLRMISHLFYKSAFVKNPAFWEEAEWRLYVSFFGVFGFSDIEVQYKKMNLDRVFSEIGVTVKNEKMIYYIDLLLGKISEESTLTPWIRKIVIGPKCKLNELDIRILLKRYGWDDSALEVVRSSASYI